MILRTPKNSSSLLLWTLFIYFTAPFFEWINLTTDLANGAFPVNADSIGIPFGGFIIIWSFSLPFILGFIKWVSQQYPSQVSLFGYTAKRPFWSFFWTVIFSFLVLEDSVSAFSDFREDYFIGVLQAILLGYFYLLLRASIVFRLKEKL